MSDQSENDGLIDDVDIRLTLFDKIALGAIAGLLVAFASFGAFVIWDSF